MGVGGSEEENQSLWETHNAIGKIQSNEMDRVESIFQMEISVMHNSRHTYTSMWTCERKSGKFLKVERRE